MILAGLLRARPPRAGRRMEVRVKGGYRPDVLHARLGEPLQLVFRREETASCSEHVVFPSLGKSAMLPPYQEVTLELLPERAGVHEFSCQLGMLRGRLVIHPPAEELPR